MRSRLAATCEALIALLDEIDGDVNLEDTADDEPHLGWPNGGQKPTAEMACDEDREADDCDLEQGSDDERELGWENDGSQASLHSSMYDGEPDLGFCGHGSGWREGETTDDRQRDAGDEREPDADFEYSLGWSTQGSQWQLGMGSAPASVDCHYDGELTTGGDGSGKHIAKKQLKEQARKKKSAGRRGKILFQRDTADTIPTPRYQWNDQWTTGLPPEAHDVLIPNVSMYRTPG